MDSKSILFTNLPDHPETQTKIIIDTFGRFYHIPKSIFRDGNKLLADEIAAALKERKRKLRQVKEAIYEHNPLFNARKLCEELIELDIKEQNKFMQKWNKTSLEKLFGKNLHLDPDVRSVVQNLVDLLAKQEDISEQKWNQLKEECSQVKARLDNQHKPLFEIQVLVKDLIELEAKDLDIFNQKWNPIAEKASRLEVDYDGIQSSINDLSQAVIKRLENHKMWIQNTSMLLKNLTKDVLLVRITNANDWNPTILNEATGLIEFIWGIFKNLAFNGLNLPIEIITEFEKAKFLVEEEYKLLGDHFTRAKDSEKKNSRNSLDAKPQGYRKVSAKTVRELYVLNHLSQKVLNGRLKLDSQQDIMDVKSEIESTLTTLHNHHEKFFTPMAEAIISDDESNRKLAWAPSMIAVVLDLHTGFLVTGATQPACKNHFILGDTAKKIPHLQVGSDFAPVIAKCYDDWRNKRCKEMRQKWSGELKQLEESRNLGKKESLEEVSMWSEEELKDLFPEQMPEVYNQLPAPEENSKILCWAVSGQTFEPKSPCPRCAYLYSSWDMSKKEDFFCRAYFFNYLNSGRADAREINEFHCAETIAAAKIYAWRHESLEFG